MVEAKQDLQGIGISLVFEGFRTRNKRGFKRFQTCLWLYNQSEIYVQPLAMGIVTKISVGPWPLRASANLFQFSKP